MAASESIVACQESADARQEQSVGQLEQPAGQPERTSDTGESLGNRRLILVKGVDGSPEFGEQFKLWISQWQSVARQAGLESVLIDRASADLSCFDQLKMSIEKAVQEQVDELWIVMLGHGTYDGSKAKFNLSGPDVSANELATWLQPRKEQTIIINCAASSAPFIDALAGPNRIVVTSTRSEYEFSFSWFGRFLAESIGSDDVDLDKDQQTSLLEAVIAAAGKTNEFYKADSRLASEHPLIEDNGDKRGTPADWFRGVRVVRTAKDGAPADGLLANQVFLNRKSLRASLNEAQIGQRDKLESQIQSLQKRRRNLTEDQYFQELESQMLQLAQIYEQADQKGQADQADNETNVGKEGGK